MWNAQSAPGADSKLARLTRTLASPTPASVRRLLRWLAVVLLVGGFGLAASIWIPQDRREHQQQAQRADQGHQVTILDPLSPEDSGRYSRDVELYYGKSGLLMDRLTRWVESLGHGKRLAWTVAVVSAVSAGGLLLLAALYRPEPRDSLS